MAEDTDEPKPKIHPLDMPIDKTKWGAGRPTKYNPEYCEKMVEMFAQGKSKTQIAVALGCSFRGQIDLWAQDHPEFREAMDYGLMLSEVWWVEQGRMALYNPGFQTPLYKFNMSHRFGIHDRVETKQLIGISQEDAIKQLDQGVTIEGEVWIPPNKPSDNA